MSAHPTALVAPGASIDPTSEIGPYCILEAGVKIGPRCRLIGHVVMRGRVTIGADNVFHPFCVIGGEPQDLGYDGAPTEVVIGDRNTFRESVTVNRGTSKGGGVTRIGNDNLFMSTAHVAHDCVVGNRVIQANNVLLAGHVRVEDHAYLSGNVVVHQFATVGKHAFASGGARIPRDAPPFMIVHGMEAEVMGVNSTGLRRAGYSPAVINALKQVHRFLWGKGLPFRDAVEEIQKGKYDQFEEVRYLLESMRRSAEGKNGRYLESLRGRQTRRLISPAS